MLVINSTDLSWVFIELGAAVAGLALLARLANRWGLSAIPLYLLAGLAFGNGGLVPLHFSESFIHIGAEIGVILLLFMLGLEYTHETLGADLRSGLPAAVFDLILNFTPGLVVGLLLRWSPLASVLLGGITYISSTGVISKILTELGRINNPETPAILSILVLEDLAMAIFLPVIAVLLIGQGALAGLISILITIVTVGIVLTAIIRYSNVMSRIVSHQSDEITLLTIFGIVLLVAGISQLLQVSAAVGAFLVGIALSGPVVAQAQRLIGPLRDLFAAIFFLFFGLQIDPATLPPVLMLAVGLGLITVLTKFLTGIWAARYVGVDIPGRLRAGCTLVAHGEFSMVIAGLGVTAGLEPQLGPLSAAYVLFLAVLGPVLARVIEPKQTAIQNR
ncbi:MAG: cation:proton antiporter [Nitrospirae bacterium]|nr:cation:proton antiporter [Nitrospirota bacterium]